MNKKLKAALALVMVLALPLAATVTFFGCAGCQSATVTQEAATYRTFKDTWTVSHAAYGAFCERVVQGKVTAEQEAQADRMWEAFRSTFRTALVAAGRNWSAPPPTNVTALASELTETLKAN
jgi:hypothetical protein